MAYADHDPARKPNLTLDEAHGLSDGALWEYRGFLKAKLEGKLRSDARDRALRTLSNVTEVLAARGLLR